jgi:hypothetical protein
MRYGLVRNPLLHISRFLVYDAYVHVPNENMSKMEKSLKSVYLLAIKMVRKVITFRTHKLIR